MTHVGVADVNGRGWKGNRAVSGYQRCPRRAELMGETKPMSEIGGG